MVLCQEVNDYVKPGFNALFGLYVHAAFGTEVEMKLGKDSNDGKDRRDWA